MNNKGFAITSILYGLLIMLLLIVMGSIIILSNQKKTMEELINGTNGARNIVDCYIILSDADFNEQGLFLPPRYCLYEYNGCKKYLAANENVDALNFNC